MSRYQYGVIDFAKFNAAAVRSYYSWYDNWIVASMQLVISLLVIDNNICIV